MWQALGMTEKLSPQAIAADIKERAYQARISINKLLGNAGVANSTLWRWEQPNAPEPHPVTLGKVLDALAQAEAAK